METLFIDNGFEVITAINGAECLAKSLSENPDLITLDISMPIESGIRTFGKLQENGVTQNIPIIIITGISGEFQKFISTRKQIYPPLGYFEKPIDRQKLVSYVKEILKIV